MACTCEALFINKIEVALRCSVACMDSIDEETLQRGCFVSSFPELLQSTRGGRKPFDPVALCFDCLTDRRERRRLAGSSHALNGMNAIRRTEHFLAHVPLRVIKFWVLTGDGQSLLSLGIAGR